MKKQLLLAAVMLLGSGVACLAAGLTAGTPQRVAQSADGLMAPVWSPDGTKIAATGPNYTGIYVFNSDGSYGMQLTDAVGAGYKMAWNADGTEIVGRTNLHDGLRVMHEIKAWNVNNGSSRTLQEKQRSNHTPESVASKVSLFRTMTTEADQVMNLDYPGFAQYAGLTVINPALSPDGKRIAFQIVGNGMFVVDVDGNNLRSIGQGSNPAWMPDNNTIVYTIVRDNGHQYTGSTLMSLTLNDMSKNILIDNDSYIPVRPSITADGSRLAFENVVDQSIYVVTLK